MALKDNGWIGVDLDATLAEYTEWTDAEKDDRVVQVVGNTGVPVEGSLSRIFEAERELTRR